MRWVEVLVRVLFVLLGGYNDTIFDTGMRCERVNVVFISDIYSLRRAA